METSVPLERHKMWHRTMSHRDPPGWQMVIYVAVLGAAVWFGFMSGGDAEPVTLPPTCEASSTMDAWRDEEVEITCGHGPDVDCVDVTEAEAQQIVDFDISDPNRLDTDGDGQACEPEP